MDLTGEDAKLLLMVLDVNQSVNREVLERTAGKMGVAYNTCR
jgi:hypothetical protein